MKAEPATPFPIVDMGLISFYLGRKVEQNQAKRMIKLSQMVYIDKVLSKFYFDQAHTLNIPIEETTHL